MIYRWWWIHDDDDDIDDTDNDIDVNDFTTMGDPDTGMINVR